MKLKKSKGAKYFVKGNVIYPLKFNKKLKEIHCNLDKDFYFGTSEKSYNLIPKGSKLVFKKHETGDCWTLFGEPKRGKVFSYLIQDEESFNQFTELSNVSF